MLAVFGGYFYFIMMVVVESRVAFQSPFVEVEK